METLGFITTISTFLSLGINYYLYKKMQHQEEDKNKIRQTVNSLITCMVETNNKLIENKSNHI